MQNYLMKNTARFDARLSLEQKELLERAAQLGGYRSLSDFILTVAEQKALEIIALEKQISLSQKDAEIICAALL
jgi:uncharacterized protein (DUF1778 family)